MLLNGKLCARDTEREKKSTEEKDSKKIWAQKTSLRIQKGIKDNKAKEEKTEEDEMTKENQLEDLNEKERKRMSTIYTTKESI